MTRFRGVWSQGHDADTKSLFISQLKAQLKDDVFSQRLNCSDEIWFLLPQSSNFCELTV